MGKLIQVHPKFVSPHPKQVIHGKDGLVLSEDETLQYAKYEPIVCKFCGSENIVRFGVREGVQNYLCRNCGRKFTAKDTPEGMRTEAEQIADSLQSFYDGLSMADIALNLERTYNNPVNPSTVYRWLIKYTGKAIEILEPMKPEVSGIYIADETAIKINGKLHWIWDCIDRDTRFLVASYLSPNRGTREAKILMELAYRRTGKPPKQILTDKLSAYLDGIELVFGADTKHIQSTPFSGTDSTNIIERFQGTIKERTKVLRGFKSLETARFILDGFMLNYNFFRPHIALNHKTPAEVAGIKTDIKTWEDVVRYG